jgi:hypothetical protein
VHEDQTGGVLRTPQTRQVPSSPRRTLMSQSSR